MPITISEQFRTEYHEARDSEYDLLVAPETRHSRPPDGAQPSMDQVWIKSHAPPIAEFIVGFDLHLTDGMIIARNVLTVIGALVMTDDDRAIQVYSKIAEQIIKEDVRVNERMTWGMSINGALLALLGVGSGLFKDILPHASISVTLFVCVIAALLSIIALFVCHWTIDSVRGAREQIYYIRKIYSDRWKTKIEDELGLPRPFGSRDLYDETIRISRWWGDDLFRFISVIWLLIIVACVAAAAFHLFGSPSGADCSGITS